MNTYMAEFDGNNNCGVAYYETNNFKELIRWVITDLEDMDGGYAAIYDEDGDFIEDVEV